MRTLTHHRLALLLVKLLPNDKFVRSAFVVGCIEPDVNLVSHVVTEQQASKRLHGHNHPHLDQKIFRMANKLKKHPQTLSPLAAYRLGILVHYLADSFTFAHNTDFPGSFDEHTAYENAFHRYFVKQVKRLHPFRISLSRGLSYSALRKRYRHTPPSFQRDFHFIVTVAFGAVATYLPHHKATC